jgi:hypothetical protein
MTDTDRLAALLGPLIEGEHPEGMWPEQVDRIAARLIAAGVTLVATPAPHEHVYGRFGENDPKGWTCGVCGFPRPATLAAATTTTLCDHPCSARVLDSGGWSCRRCEQFCEPPCPTCATPAPLDVEIPMCVADCGCAGARIAETCDFIPGCSRCTPAPLDLVPLATQVAVTRYEIDPRHAALVAAAREVCNSLDRLDSDVHERIAALRAALDGEPS